MWVLVINGLVYLGFVYLHGEWRDLVPRRGVVRDAIEMVKFYVAARRDHPRQGKHNALQRLTYFSLPFIAVASVLSGLAIWKPVQLAPLTWLLGGFVWARYWHFLAMTTLVAVSFVHVFMVFAVDPYSLRAMVTGRYNEAKSPERRNARPFVNLRAPPRRSPPRRRRAPPPNRRRDMSRRLWLSAPPRRREARHRPARIPGAASARAR